ncbi:MAG TPA: energy-coupling factor ABC transporter ATP-binding protein [Anaerolineae bacterium]|nr:energy-coupling factor ABC transporter ATP-binding protein [Anaerolineae bacterium]
MESGPPIVEAHDLQVRYPEAGALRGVDLSIAPGSFVLIGGPSGGGKSTLAHALVGLIPQVFPAEVEGNVRVAGLDPWREPIARVATHVGLVLQNPATQLFNSTVEEEVAFGPRNLGLPPEEIAARVAYALEATGCDHLLHRSVRHLSGGEQQRVAIAAVLAMRPSVLVLDEPTANLDEEGAQAVVRALAGLRRRLGVTVVVIEHRLDRFLPYADRLVWLEDGRVVADGPPAETLARVLPSHPPHRPDRRRTETPLVSLEGVTAGYDGQTVLSDCSLTLYKGEFAALVGPNGAGKTTLARVLAGLLRPRAGRVAWHADGRRARVGFLQQNALHQLVCDTVEEEVLLGPRNLGLMDSLDVDPIFERTGLAGLRHRPTYALSVGQQQRTVLAATLSLQPSLLILDEPTLGQDPVHLHRMMDFLADLNRSGQTILLITHDRRLVDRYATRVLEVREGRVSERRHPGDAEDTGKPPEILQKGFVPSGSLG